MHIEDQLCPLARTFGADKLQAKCRGPECAAYRELPLSASEPSFLAAVKREEASLAQDEGKGRSANLFHKKAVANVTKDPEAYGVNMVRDGYCGFAGEPK